jgi:hypothetical protein
MKSSIGQHEQYALVSPQMFVDRFTTRWTQEFNMPASESLRKLWLIMANTYRQSIIATAQDQPCRLRWSRLSEQIFRVDKWSLCRG